VLICPPFGWEDMCSYRSRRIWAEQLAQAGHVTLRFDFPGSGDSAGDPESADLVEAWTEAVDVAASWLSAEAGGTRVVAVGIGIGGLIAFRAAAMGAAIDDLALWAVDSRGRSHTRELRAFAAMEANGDQSGSRSGPLQAHENGSDPGALGVAGYLLSGATRAELDAVDLGTMALDGAAERRVLLIGRDGREVDARLKESVAASGATVTTAPGSGYMRMVTFEPQYAVPAQTVFDDVATWLADGAVEPRAPHSTPVAATDRAEPVSGVLEIPVALYHPTGDAFGVIAEPTGARADLCVVWLNAGPQRHTGPNRMWTEAARRWAARGVPSVRIDLAAIGDAVGDERPLADARAFYVPRYVDQVRAVLDELTDRGMPERFVLCGLCAGGYWALQASLDDGRVAGAILLNPGALVWDHGLSLAVGQTRRLVHKALQTNTWRRVFAGETTLSSHLRTLRVLTVAGAKAIVAATARLWRRHPATGDSEDELAVLFGRISAAGRTLRMVFAGPEPLYERLLREPSIQSLERWPAVSLAHIDVDHEVHTLRPLWLQHRVHGLIDEAIESELQRAQSDAAAPS
jgi:alpha-beta hydrolase superfamily lysophospholipase